MAEVRRIVELRADALERAVPDDVEAMLRALSKQAGSRRTVLEVSPNPEELDIEGTVVSVDLQVNVLKRFKAEDNAFSRAFYAKLLKEPQAEVVLQTKRDVKTGYISQFTFYYPVSRIKESGVRASISAGTVLSGLVLPDERCVWVALDMYRLQ